MKHSKKKIGYFMLFGFFICSSMVWANDTLLFFNHLTSKDGLSNRYNAFIKKDSKGIVWISSTDGIYYHDGLQLKKHQPEDKTGLLDKNIQSNFFEDKQSNIWFTPNSGINCYKRKTNTFDAIFLHNQEGKEIKDGYQLIHLERDSILWLKVGNTIYNYSIFTGQQDSIATTNSVRFAVDTFSNGKVKSIIACPWMNGPGIEFITFSPKNKILKQQFFSTGIPPDYTEPLEVPNAIIEEDSLIWLFSNQGLIAFNPLRPHTSTAYHLPNQPKTILMDGAIINEKYLWAGIKNQGIWLFDKQKKQFSRQYNHHPNDPNSISSNAFWEIYVDPHQHLWLSNFSEAAIDECWMDKNHFDNPFSHIKMDAPPIRAMIKDHQQQIWCATRENGIYVFEENGQFKKRFDLTEQTKTNSNMVKEFSMDVEGRLWAVGSEFISFFQDGIWKTILKRQDITFLSLLHISSTSKWISTNKGVLKLSVDAVNYQVKEEGFIPSGDELKIYKFFKGQQQRIYASNNGSQLLIYKQQEDNIQLLKTIKFEMEVYDILELPNQTEIGLATDKGLWILDLKTFKYKNFFEENKPLKNSHIYSIVEDDSGGWWLTTDQALWHYQVDNKQLYQYRKQDGLPSNNFPILCTQRASDKGIWIGTDKGLIHFYPNSIRPYPYAPIIRINSLKINNQIYNSEFVIDETPSVQLSPQENNLQFVLQGVTHYLPKLVRIFYRLKGYDSEWKSIENGEAVTFSQIPDNSDYELEMYAVSANGVKSKVRTLGIDIKPPYWKIWQFWALMFIGLLGFGYFIFQFLLRRRLAEQEAEFERQRELEKALQEERNRIADDMHDDLGGKLSSIQFLLRPIKKENLSQKATENLDKVAKYAKESVENMRDIIWIMNGDNDSLSKLIAHIRWKIIDFFEDHHLNCIIPLSGELPDFVMNGKQRRNIFLCIKEASHNIVKHAAASKVLILFEYDKLLKITIQDNGKGIDKTQLNQFGNGLRTMEKRMKEINGTINIKKDNGTIVTFTIPLDIDNKGIKTQ